MVAATLANGRPRSQSVPGVFRSGAIVCCDPRRTLDAGQALGGERLRVGGDGRRC